MLKKHSNVRKDYKNDSPYSMIRLMDTQRRIIEANYVFSQESIDTIKSKLTTKMNSKDRELNNH